MFRKRFSNSTIAAMLFLFPAQLLAGGPPWLSMPIDGVTTENAAVCAQRLSEALERPIEEDGISLQQVGQQWYLRMGLGRDVTLHEIEDALKDSGFSVPQDTLRLFGHVILEIDMGSASGDELKSALEGMDYVAVAESEQQQGMLHMTVDMPYPRFRDRQSLDWVSFGRCDFSTASTRSEAAATAADLPSYADFQAVIEQHNATLADVRWSTSYACRPLGCVAVAEFEAKDTQTSVRD